MSDEGLRIETLLLGKNICVSNCAHLTVPNQKATANYVPAAAVIRRWQALSGIIGRKARVGGFLSLMLKPTALPWRVIGNW